MLTISLPSAPAAPDEGPPPFAVAHGSVMGREHRRISRNNQDAVGLSRGAHWLVAVVTDGCSAGEHSEVGARLGAAWLTAWIPPTLEAAGPAADPADPRLVERWTAGLATYLASVRAGLQAPCAAGTRTQGILDPLRAFFLFGFLVAVIGTRRSAIIGLGDGVYSVDGEAHVLDAGPDNAPPYLAYRLAPHALARPSCTEPRVHFAAATADIETVVIATDGAAELLSRTGEGLRGFEREPRYLRNPSLLQKRLRVLGELEGRLSDDTTIVLLRRRSAHAAANLAQEVL